MYKLCKTEQSAQRQRLLERELLQVMKAKRFEEISVSDLCDHIGIPRKSFYRYFSSKDGALFALLDHTLLEFYEEENGTMGKRSGTAIGDLDRFFLFWYERRDLLEALLRSGLSGLLVERATALAEKEQLMPGYIRKWTANVQTMALSFAVCGLISMVFQWHIGGYQLTPAEMAQIATAMLTKPLLQ